MKYILEAPPHRIFLCTASVMGFLFLILIPPFQNPDEDVHFYRAYQVASLNLVSDKTTDATGGHMPRSIRWTYLLNDMSIDNRSIKLSKDSKYNIDNINVSMEMPLDKTNTEEVSFSSSGVYSPVSYLPQAIVIALGKAFDAPVLVLMYLARLAGLLLYIFTITLCIKLIPVKKNLLLILGLLPMMLAQTAAVSADTILYVLIISFVSLISYVSIIEKKITPRIMIGFIILCALIAVSKQVFILFVPLLLLIPVARFSSRKMRYTFFASAFLVATLSYSAWAALSHDSTAFAENVSNGANIERQIDGIVHSPIEFAKTLSRTYFTSDGDYIYESFAGNFGWLNAPLNFPTVLLVYLTVFLAVFSSWKGQRGLHYSHGLYGNLTLLAVGLLVALAVSVALYAAYTAVGAPVIRGIQGRYFMPLIFLALLAQYKPLFIFRDKTVWKSTLYLGSVACLVGSVATIFGRYY